MENTTNKMDKQAMVFSYNKTPSTILKENELPFYQRMWMNSTAIKWVCEHVCMCVYACAYVNVCEYVCVRAHARVYVPGCVISFI